MNPDERSGNCCGNASNHYPEGTTHYEIIKTSTSAAIVIIALVITGLML
ncbi:hypothetical protein QY97_01943 [Bacillus thermotolerans]|nr:hypothetical protein QY97_01943 [Bacillus thermotolerans]